MRSLIIAALVAIPALSGAASADENRMTQTEFVRAARCLSFANLSALQSDKPDTSALVARYNAERAVKPSDIQRRASNETRRALIYAAQADTPQEIQKLKARRDRLCGEFIEMPVVAQN